MGGLIRRNKVVPVTARRVAGDPQQVVIDSASAPITPAAPPSQASPPSQQHTTQNIFYVNVPPAAAPTPAPPQPPPPQIHIIQTEIHHAPRRRRSPRMGTSFFGMLAVLAGAAAFGATYIPPAAPYAVQLAKIGVLLGGAGWLISILFRKSGPLMPIFGLAVSAGAWLYAGGYLPQVKLDFKSIQTTPLAPNSPAAPSSASPTTPNAAKPQSIFDFGNETAPVTPPPAPPTVKPQPTVPPIGLTKAQAGPETGRKTPDASQASQRHRAGTE